MAYLNFLLSKEEQDRIENGTITIENIKEDLSNIPLELIHGFDAWAPQSLLFKFKMKDPLLGAPRLLSLFTSNQTHKFINDELLESNQHKFTPNKDEVDSSLSSFDSWQTQGIYRIINADTKLQKRMLNEGVAEEVPNILWYYPVQLKKENFNSRASHIKHKNLIISPEFSKFFPSLVSGFLQGKIQFYMSENPTVEMIPTTVMDANGWVNIIVSMAYRRNPQDSKLAFDKYHTDDNITKDSVRYAGNGLIPPKYIYSFLEPALNHIDGKLFVKLKSNVDDYFTLRFTRTAKNKRNFSFFFPGQTIEIKENSNSIWKGKLQAHGIVFIPETLLGTDPTNTTNTLVTIEPLRTHRHTSPSLEMSMLKGNSDCWKKMGSTTEDLEIDLFSLDYVVLRLRMKDAVFLEEENRVGLVLPDEKLECNNDNFIHIQLNGPSSCTYFSLRRVIRALVDNRITGGRLKNMLPKTKDPVTASLIEGALGEQARIYLMNNQPPTTITTLAGVSDNNSKLFHIMTKLFPGKGALTYKIWQSIVNGMQENETHRGHGAPGAMVYLGLAKYIVNPENYNTNLPPQIPYNYQDITNAVIEKIPDDDFPYPYIQKGALIQFWKHGQTYAEIREGKKMSNITRIGTTKNTFLGHSVIFYSKCNSSTDCSSFHAVDQRGCGEAKQSTQTNLLEYRKNTFSKIEIWIIANWIE